MSSGRTRFHPRAMACAACRAVSVPLNLPGETRTRMAAPRVLQTIAHCEFQGHSQEKFFRSVTRAIERDAGGLLARLGATPHVCCPLSVALSRITPTPQVAGGIVAQCLQPKAVGGWFLGPGLKRAATPKLSSAKRLRPGQGLDEKGTTWPTLRQK